MEYTSSWLTVTCWVRSLFAFSTARATVRILVMLAGYMRVSLCFSASTWPVEASMSTQAAAVMSWGSAAWTRAGIQSAAQSPAAAQASPRRSPRPRLLRKAVSFPTGSFIYKIVPLIVFSPQSNGILAFIIAAFLYFSQVARKYFHHFGPFLWAKLHAAACGVGEIVV